MSSLLSTNYQLPLAIIHVSGLDSKQFLHSQLTQSIIDIDNTKAKLFGYCNNKGRLIANGVLFNKNEDIYILIDNTIADSFIKKLSMFILRSKVKIQLTSKQSFYTKTLHLSNFLDIQTNENNFCIIWNKGALLITDDIQPIELQEYVSVDEYKKDNIEHGLFFINSNNTQEYIPQMLNFEVLGGVNFKKGCYPGQEIVARSQYLGKIKKTSIFCEANIDEINIDNINNYKITNTQDNNIQECIADIIEYSILDNKIYLLLCIRTEYINSGQNIYLYNNGKFLTLNYKLIAIANVDNI